MIAADPLPGAWSDALLAATLFAIDPAGLGGVSLRSGPGPARDAWTAALQALLPADGPVRRVPLRIEDDRLLGGLDLSASLAAGRPVLQTGVLAACDGGVALLGMAERIETGTGARLAAVLDAGAVVIEREGLATRLPARLGLVALDEGREPDERPPDALLDRLAFRIDLATVGARDCDGAAVDADAAAAGRAALAAVGPPGAAILEALCRLSDSLGLGSSRPALLALRAARAHAALHGRTEIAVEDAAAATRLVLVPRGLTALPEAPDADDADEAAEPADAAPEPPPQTAGEPENREAQDGEARDGDDRPDADAVLEAIKATLPEDLLDRVATDGRRGARATRGQGGGAVVKAARRGRPLGSRTGALRGGERLNLPETLRAATPWQALRPAAPGAARIQVRPEDFRLRRFVQRQETTTIFVVDASGSAAVQRLAEAKGAVELLLAKAYVARSRVALIAFRQQGAEVLLEPTRSLTRAKRSLADLPGGGGTPLAAGLDAALQLAEAERARDRTPLIVVLTDGRANIGRGGAPGRAGAERDALAAARQVGEAGVGGVFIDTAPRAQPGGDRFARAMGAVYAPLPYVEAAAVSALVAGLQTPRR